MDGLPENFKFLGWERREFNGDFFDERENRIVSKVRFCYMHFDSVSLPIKENGFKVTKTFENCFVTVPFMMERFNL